jgi:hypothetical protein
MLLVANITNLGADLRAMGAALKLLIAGPALLYVCFFGLFSVALVIFARHAGYVSILKWLCLSLFSYVICAFVVRVPWAEVGWAAIWPPLSMRPGIMGGLTLPLALRIVGWAATIVMAITVVAMVATWLGWAA